MLTVADLAAYQRTLDEARDAARTGLFHRLRDWDVEDAKRAERQALEALRELTADYAPDMAATAADFLDLAADAQGFRGAPRVTLAPPPGREVLAGDAGWASSPLYGARPDVTAFAGRLALTLDARLNAAQAETLTSGEGGSRKVSRQRTRYMRVTAGKCCAFCLMLASRGAVYRNPNTPTVHAYCRCTVVPVLVGSISEENVVKGYSPAEAREAYYNAAASAGSKDLKAILAEMRRQNPGLH